MHHVEQTACRVPLDEQEPIEIEQGVAEGNPACQPTRLQIDATPSLFRDCLKSLQFGQPGIQPRQLCGQRFQFRQIGVRPQPRSEFLCMTHDLPCVSQQETVAGLGLRLRFRRHVLDSLGPRTRIGPHAFLVGGPA